MPATSSALTHFPPMGIYEVLYSFLDSTASYLGTAGTHPFAQGFPLTTRLPNGPELPSGISFSPDHLKYPPATGGPELLDAICEYYNHYYGSNITRENVAVFAGGRPALYAALTFLKPEYKVLIEETEYTPYYDVLELLKRDYAVIPSNISNNFRPTLSDYDSSDFGTHKFILKSNPCNPTGVTWTGDTLRELVSFCSRPMNGGIVDEAYEFFHDGSAVSAMQYVGDINNTNLFVVGAATKGLQVPGMRIGWAIASKENIELFRNYSSLAMGGVSRASQLYVAKCLDLKRVDQARDAVRYFFGKQRDKYRAAFDELGFELFTGNGGFYHWCRLPNDLRAAQFNERLFQKNAAILPGYLCDMYRRGNDGPLGKMFRFSFGAVPAEDFDESVKLLRDCIR
jgi:aspartate/methionine/tyrosine aminotransferase